MHFINANAYGKGGGGGLRRGLGGKGVKERGEAYSWGECEEIRHAFSSHDLKSGRSRRRAEDALLIRFQIYIYMCKSNVFQRIISFHVHARRVKEIKTFGRL